MQKRSRSSSATETLRFALQSNVCNFVRAHTHTPIFAQNKYDVNGDRRVIRKREKNNKLCDLIVAEPIFFYFPCSCAEQWAWALNKRENTTAMNEWICILRCSTIHWGRIISIIINYLSMKENEHGLGFSWYACIVWSLINYKPSAHRQFILFILEWALRLALDIYILHLQFTFVWSRFADGSKNVWMSVVFRYFYWFQANVTMSNGICRESPSIDSHIDGRCMKYLIRRSKIAHAANNSKHTQYSKWVGLHNHLVVSYKII